jgi:hypothetical protein
MRNIPISKFGKDHWSLLAYIECRCVDNKGVPDLRQMRCNGERHPDLEGASPVPRPMWQEDYHTKLNNGQGVVGHDDHDCAEDLEKAGFIVIRGTGINPVYTMTEKGWETVGLIRRFKATGGSFGTFQYSE